MTKEEFKELAQKFNVEIYFSGHDNNFFYEHILMKNDVPVGAKLYILSTYKLVKFPNIEDIKIEEGSGLQEFHALITLWSNLL